MTEATTNEAVAAEKTELSLDDKIAALKARLAKLEQQKLTESLLENIQKGDKVTIKFGRGEKVREIDGEVVGVSLPNVAVLSDDLDTYKVHIRDVISNPAAAERAGLNTYVEDVAEIDPVTGRRPDEAGPQASEIAEGVVEGSAADDPLLQA